MQFFAGHCGVQQIFLVIIFFFVNEWPVAKLIWLPRPSREKVFLLNLFSIFLQFSYFSSSSSFINSADDQNYFFCYVFFLKKTSFVLFKVPIMNKIESLVIVVVLRHHDSTHNDRCFLHNGTFSMQQQQYVVVDVVVVVVIQ